MIQSSGGLSEDEIQNMVKDAESHKASDEARKKLIEARNEADSLIYRCGIYICLHLRSVHVR